ncbi:MAG: Ig-like domain-containing protein [Proteobacteria bacterium]|nr:Ig-like domain-containing protein [Pseudomonadota bacterium]
MIRQIRLKDNFNDVNGTAREEKIFAFGTHPSALDANGQPDMDQQHTALSASALSNSLRIIVDELLIGNNLEEIECRALVDDDVFDRVPLGATPADIARCAAPRDVLPNTCLGENTVCICHRAGGCSVNGTMIAENGPVGVLDADEDGAADNTRFIRDSVGITCGGTNVPIDLDLSYYTPSGNQNVPAMGGFDVLGPAIVLTPAGALRTNSMCELKFSPTIVDKEDHMVCAPPNGDVTKDCVEGDVSAFKFTVQPLVLTPQIADGSTGVPRTDPLVITANVPLATDTVTKIQVTENGVAFPAASFTATLANMDRAVLIAATAGTGFAANKTYVVTFPVTVTDAAGSPLTSPFTLTFTTGAL